MAFFDTKEEVINIQLTPYGKYLLASGKWKPAYYELYDDDITYDGEYIGIQEKQEEIRDRIRETSRIKTQYCFDGAETRFKIFKKKLESSKDKEYEPEKRNNFSFSSLPLGNSSPSSQNAPSVRINSLSSEISSFVQEQMISSDPASSIKTKGLPNDLWQINMKEQFRTLSLRLKQQDENLEKQTEKPERDIEQIELGEDILEVTIDKDYLLFDLSEIGVDVEKENFEVLFYEIREDEKTGEIVEKPLTFRRERQNVINNIYLEPSEIEYTSANIRKNSVEAYFEVLTDREIQNRVFCEHLNLEQIQLLNSTQGYGIVCEEVQGIKVDNKQLKAISRQIADLEEC